jgi:polar amino acid transport system substrate-binding protein
VLLLYAAWASLWPQVQAELNWRALQQRGQIRIGIDPGLQPFSFYDNGGWAGYDADLAHELATLLDLPFTTDPVGYDAMYDALATGRVDMVLSAVVLDPSRTADAAYTRAYFDVGPRLLSPAHNPIKTPSALAHQRVAVGLGSEADYAARFWQRRVANMQRINTADDAAAWELLRANQVHAAIVNGLFRKPHMAQFHSYALAPRQYVIALHHNQTRLLHKLNAALETLQANGTLARLEAKWLLPK